MDAPTEFYHYKDVLVILGTAGVMVPLMVRLKISPVLGFLLAGFLLGPKSLGALTDFYPWLAYVTISNQEKINSFGELGVVFLLFFVGLELSLQRLITMRKLVFGLGTLQILISTIAIAAILNHFGQNMETALIIGSALALSSTAIVIEVLSHQKRLKQSTGRSSFSILLMQDLAVVPIIFLVGLLGAKSQGSIFLNLLFALLQAGLVIGLITIIGQYALRPLFRMVAAARSTDMLVAVTLLVTLGTGILTASFGLSMALGAFMAGLLLAETEYRRVIESTLEPFKGILLGIFFFSVGMHLDPVYIAENIEMLALAMGALIAVKGGVIVALVRLFGFRWTIAIKTALLLSAGGEFAFVVINMAKAKGLLDGEVSGFILTVTAFSMALIPLLDVIGKWIAARLDPPRPPDMTLASSIPQAIGEKRALLVGFGRVGHVTAKLLAEHKLPFLAIDHDADVVARARIEGYQVYYGEVTNFEFLKACGIHEAPVVIITGHDHAMIDKIVTTVRALRGDVPIISRAHDAEHARHLYALGVTEAIPETLEASLQLSQAALLKLGMAAEPVNAIIAAHREHLREELLQAAQGLAKTVEIKA
jgi:CPA2 family monovalent cation:H+ antiporter-2